MSRNEQLFTWRRKLSTIILWFLAAILVLSGCSFPVPGPAPAITPAIDPNLVLTQAVQTIEAQVQATLTQAVILAPTLPPASPTSTPVADTATPTQIPPTPTATLPPTATSVEPTAGGGPAGPGATATSESLSRTATATSSVSWDAFKVPAMNIHNCGSPMMIFAVRNRSGETFESVELLIENLDRERALYGPHNSDAPFLQSDKDCSPGGDRLASGGLGYVGGLLERQSRSGDQIRATILFCTAEGLGGRCYERVIEFYMP